MAVWQLKRQHVQARVEGECQGPFEMCFPARVTSLGWQIRHHIWNSAPGSRARHYYPYFRRRKSGLWEAKAHAPPCFIKPWTVTICYNPLEFFSLIRWRFLRGSSRWLQSSLNELFCDVLIEHLLYASGARDPAVNPIDKLLSKRIHFVWQDGHKVYNKPNTKLVYCRV